MKKNRLATKLTLLAEIDRMDTLIKAIFSETSSIGIRYFPTERRVLERTFHRISLCGGMVRIKTAAFEDQEINIQPEFDDCVKLAKKTQIPVKKIFELALREFHRERETATAITNSGKSSKHTKKDLK